VVTTESCMERRADSTASGPGFRRTSNTIIDFVAFRSLMTATQGRGMDTIPFCQPVLMGQELEYMQQAIRAQRISGDGRFTKACQAILEDLIGVKKALLTTSCTDALELAALLLDIAPGDEVIVPTFTFVSTANAFVLRGARAVFVDIRSDTLNLDEQLVAQALGPRTRAVVAVHYAGVGCEMDDLLSAIPPSVTVVEDNAHGLFGRYRGRSLGTFGAFSTLSFHETKNITCGEGGALLINDPRFIERAEVLREKGTNRSRFFRGEVDRYTWVDVGSSFLPSDLLAGFLLAQLEARDRIQAVRKRAWEFYRTELADWAGQRGFRLPQVPPHCEQPFHLFYLLLPSLEDRTSFIRHLRDRGVTAPFHYVPLHLSDMGLRLGGRKGTCPVAESVSERLVRLPLFNDLSQDTLSYIVDAVRAFCTWLSRLSCSNPPTSRGVGTFTKPKRRTYSCCTTTSSTTSTGGATGIGSRPSRAPSG
jgi:dTDP-4-amino-4,6-dideoxygalactose transaminase